MRILWGAWIMVQPMYNCIVSLSSVEEYSYWLNLSVLADLILHHYLDLAYLSLCVSFNNTFCMKCIIQVDIFMNFLLIRCDFLPMLVPFANIVQQQCESIVKQRSNLTAVLPLAAKLSVKLARSNTVITTFTQFPNVNLQLKKRGRNFCLEPRAFNTFPQEIRSNQIHTVHHTKLVSYIVLIAMSQNQG